MPIIRLVIVLLVIALLAWGVQQRHAVTSFADTAPRTLPGMAWREAPETTPWWPASFAEGATVEAFVRRADGLFNVYALASGEASLKDCKT